MVKSHYAFRSLDRKSEGEASRSCERNFVEAIPDTIQEIGHFTGVIALRAARISYDVATLAGSRIVDKLYQRVI